MASISYLCKDPAHYAAQRLGLAARVRDGMPVRAAARFLKIPYSTAWLWIAQDGLRKADRAADDAGEARPAVGRWAQPGRGRARARPAPQDSADGLPPADYPALKGLTPRKRLSALAGLADTAEMRAVAAIEEGCITFGLASLREAQRLRRAWRALQDGLAQYPEPEDPDADDTFDEFVEALLAEQEGRAPLPAPPCETPPEDPVSAEIWNAGEAAEAEDLSRLGLAEDDFSLEDYALRQLDLAMEHRRLMEARARWMSLPGRAPPPVIVRLPERRRRTGDRPYTD